MSTWALLGLLVVVLVAVGIAAFLRWRNRDAHPTSHDGDAPPRTVADLVDRRARGLDDHPRRPETTEAGPVADEAAEAPSTDDDRSEDAAADAGTGDVVSAAVVSPDEDSTDGDSGAGDSGEQGVGTGAADEVSAEGDGDEATPVLGTVSAIGTTHSSAPDITEVDDGDGGDDGDDDGDATDRVPHADPAEPRVSPDVSIGPVGPPWSRGFKDGKPVEPVEPPTAPTRPVSRPSPVARRRSADLSGAEAAGRGPDSSAPDISTARDGSTTGATSADATSDSAATADSAAAGDTTDDLAPAWSVAGPAPDGPADEVEVDEIAAGRAPGGGTDPTDPIEFGHGAESPGTTATDPGSSRTAGAAGAVVAGAAGSGTAAGGAGRDESADRSTGRDVTAADAVSRPAAPARADSRSPVDPDLVKRVTAVPVERPASRGAATPDTEREFREARDRIAGQQGSTGRVPEQQGPPDPGRPAGDRPAPLGVVPGGAPSRDTGDRPEPPPRPAPRLLRSTRPAEQPAAPHDADSATESPAETSPSAPSTEPEASPAVTPSRAVAPPATETETPSATETESASATESATVAPSETGAESVETPAGTGGPVDEQAGQVEENDRAGHAEEVALTVPRSGPEPAAIVPGTAPQDVEVQVLDPHGEPLIGADVSVRDRAGGPVGSAVTGADGVARIPVPGSGSFVTVAGLDGYRPGVAACSVGDAGAGTVLRLTPAAAVHGSARTATGAPAAGVAVVLEQDGEPIAEARTAADGTFRLPELDAGRYRLVGASGTGVDVEVPPGGDVEQDVAGS